MADRAQRYSAIAIVLHWSIAFAILLNLPLGLWMHEQAEHGGASEGLFDIYQLHKSIGLTVLALSLVRLAWRLMHPPPPFAEGVAPWERFIAKTTHWAFYVLMIGVPLSGWIMKTQRCRCRRAGSACLKCRTCLGLRAHPMKPAPRQRTSCWMCMRCSRS
jgi:cytochrome b561